MMEKYLTEKFGKEEGSRILQAQQRRLADIILKTTGKSSNQMKILIKTILPCIALYLVLKEDNAYKTNKAEDILENYICNTVGAELHQKYVIMEKVPFFYYVYSKVFTVYTKKSDLWESKSKVEKNEFYVNITRCLWNDACKENGCPELCQYFCKSDYITYGGLKKISFHRTKTLGTGGGNCDFCFYKKQG